MNPVHWQNILYYMAGWASRQVLKLIDCEGCKLALITSTPYHTFLGRLTMAKNQGGLLYASRSTYRVILLADRAMNHVMIHFNGRPSYSKQLLQQLVLIVYQACSVDLLVFPELTGHDGSNLMDQHVERLIKLLARQFLTARLCHLGKQYTLSVFGASSSKHNQLKRMAIFQSL